ncbi:unnamed protein product [Vitrella brassicaformis CCMP3155]|uniref:Suppressor of forked domain-containing protein n=1 Tax=Vitrella brassicaformis (strain CCMP3155) TaxID=1169540 RepID=A0A0G4F6H8_VITBC|nr:unnamed protein product [Vitrella brassicaformis CCMP3155]|eukprot:CEM07632.1 unnamed protein product [Vitrella brassicaformis CCMP3155]
MAEVEANPLDVQKVLIDIARENGDSTALVKIRQQLAAHAPMGQDFWTEWISDMIDADSPPPEVLEVCKQSVELAPSTSCWLQSLHLVETTVPSVGVEQSRVCAGEGEGRNEAQVMMIRRLFHTELRLPLSELDKTLRAYRSVRAAPNELKCGFDEAEACYATSERTSGTSGRNSRYLGIQLLDVSNTDGCGEEPIGPAQRHDDSDLVAETQRLLAAYAPAGDEFWTEWISNALDNHRDVQEVVELGKRGVELAPSAACWIAYLHVLESQPSMTVGKMRQVYEQAVDAVGHHAVEGPKMWAAWREYEARVCAKGSGEKGDHTQAIRRLFHRQLALPLNGIHKTLREYRSWEDRLPEGLRTPCEAE